MTLYRAVSGAERTDIATTGRLRASAGSMEGKWFAEERAHARAWGRSFYAAQTFWIVAVKLPAAVADALYRSDPHLDQIGPARYAEPRQVEGAILEEIEEVTP